MRIKLSVVAFCASFYWPISIRRKTNCLYGIKRIDLNEAVPMLLCIFSTTFKSGWTPSFYLAGMFTANDDKQWQSQDYGNYSYTCRLINLRHYHFIWRVLKKINHDLVERWKAMTEAPFWYELYADNILSSWATLNSTPFCPDHKYDLSFSKIASYAYLNRNGRLCRTSRRGNVG